MHPEGELNEREWARKRARESLRVRAATGTRESETEAEGSEGGREGSDRWPMGREGGNQQMGERVATDR